ncbi:MAG: hypothetical protein WA215_00430 [Candidatus Cybelea sp.]
MRSNNDRVIHGTVFFSATLLIAGVFFAMVQHSWPNHGRETRSGKSAVTVRPRVVATEQNSDSSDSATESSSGTITRDTMLFTTTAGFCEWINEEEALKLGKRYTPHGDMGQTETGQLVKSGDSVQIGLTVRTECRDLWGNGSERNPVWVKDQTSPAEGWIEQTAISWANPSEQARFEHHQAEEQEEEKKLAAIEAAKLAAQKMAAIRKADGCYEPGALSDAALNAIDKEEWQSAFDTAQKGLKSNETCRNTGHKILNDGFLMTAKGWSEWHLGMKSQALADMQSADSLLQRCSDSGADKTLNANCDLERAGNASMLDVWKSE